MTNGEILEGIRDVAREFLDLGADVGLDTDIVGDLELDSIELLTLVVELENHFQIFLDEGRLEEADELRTIGDLVAHIAGRLRQSESAGARGG